MKHTKYFFVIIFFSMVSKISFCQKKTTKHYKQVIAKDSVYFYVISPKDSNDVLVCDSLLKKNLSIKLSNNNYDILSYSIILYPTKDGSIIVKGNSKNFPDPVLSYFKENIAGSILVIDKMIVADKKMKQVILLPKVYKITSYSYCNKNIIK